MLRAKSREVNYPERDGKPMGETDLHRQVMLAIWHALSSHFSSEPDVYVSGNILLYWVEGETNLSVSPDCFVVKGIKKGLRRTYKVWEEKPPNVVIEVTSRWTRLEDQHTKTELYRDALRVKEYFLFDPTGDWIPGQIVGHRRTGRAWRTLTGAGRGLLSQELGLILRVEDSWLRFVEPKTGRLLPFPWEEAEVRQREAEGRQREAEARQREAEGRQREAEARQRAEEERDRLRAEIERLKRERKNGP